MSFDQFIVVYNIVTGVHGTTHQGTTNRNEEQRFGCIFTLRERKCSRVPVPERGTLRCSRSAVTKVCSLDYQKLVILLL